LVNETEKTTRAGVGKARHQRHLPHFLTFSFSRDNLPPLSSDRKRKATASTVSDSDIEEDDGQSVTFSSDDDALLQSEPDDDPPVFELLPKPDFGADHSDPTRSHPMKSDRIIYPKLNEPAFAGHPQKLREMITDLMQVGVAGNVSYATQAKYFKAIQAHLPVDHQFPSFELATKMITKSSRQVLTEIPACRNDCQVWSPRDLVLQKTKKCQSCRSALESSSCEYEAPVCSRTNSSCPAAFKSADLRGVHCENCLEPVMNSKGEFKVGWQG
jgi:hypothetical protein